MQPPFITRHRAIAAAILFLAFSPRAGAGDWPQWRGPNGDGTCEERGLPTEWSRTQNIAWRFDLPGPAGSTPAVWGERIFLTSPAGEDDLLVLCVARDGKELWRHRAGGGNRDFRGDEGNCAAPSPATDGKRVWAFFGTGQLVCLDVEGKLVWEKDLQKLYGPYDHWHGYSSTPLLDGDVLYQMCIRMKDPYLLALDKLTGGEKWKRTRECDAEHESRHSYASPVLYRDKERAFLLAHGGDCITAHNLEDGGEVWRCGSLNPRERYNRTLRFVASPVARPGLIVVPSAKGNPVLAVRPDGKGDVTGSHVAWRRPRDTTDVPTPVIHDGLVYVLRESGVLICIDAGSGEEVYLQRLHDGRQRASPVIADGKLFCAARNGVVHVVKPGRKFEVLSRNDMDEAIASTPAIGGGRIYLRTFKALYAIEKLEQAGAAGGEGAEGR